MHDAFVIIENGRCPGRLVETGRAAPVVLLPGAQLEISTGPFAGAETISSAYRRGECLAPARSTSEVLEIQPKATP